MKSLKTWLLSLVAIGICIACPLVVAAYTCTSHWVSAILDVDLMPFTSDALLAFVGTVVTVFATVMLANRELKHRNLEKEEEEKRIELLKERCVPAFETRITMLDSGIEVVLFNRSEFDYYCLEYSDCITEYLMKSTFVRRSEFRFIVSDVEALCQHGISCPVFPSYPFKDIDSTGYNLLLFCQDKFNRLWALNYSVDPDGPVRGEPAELLPS